MPLSQILERVEFATRKVLEVLVFLFFLTMTVLTFAQVFSRFFLNASLSWSEELARFSLVWLVFTASILTYGDKMHIAVDALTMKLTGMTSHVLQLTNRLFVLVFCGIIVLGAVQFLPTTAIQKSPACGLFMSYVYVAIPVSMAFMALITIKEICSVLAAMRRSEEDAA